VNGADFDALDEQIETSSDTSGGGSGDYRELPWVNLTPRVAVAGTITDLASTCDLDAEQNVRGGGIGGDVILTLDDPEVLLGDTFENRVRSESGEIVREAFADDDEVSSVDYRVVDADDEVIGEHVEKNDDGDYVPTGITYYDNPFRSTERDGFRDEEAVEVFVSSHAGQLIFGALHAGPVSAYYPEGADGLGDHNGGAVEFPPNYNGEEYDPTEDGYPRIANAGALHPDLVGERVIVYMKWGDETQGNRKHIGHVLWDRGEDGLTEMTNLVTDDPLEPAMDAARDTYANLVWDTPAGGGGGGNGSGGASTTATTDDASDTAFDALDGQIEDGGDGPTNYTDLGPNERDFVDEVVGIAAKQDSTPAAVVGGDDEFVAAWDEETTLEGTVDGATALQIAKTRFQMESAA